MVLVQDVRTTFVIFGSLWYSLREVGALGPLSIFWICDTSPTSLFFLGLEWLAQVCSDRIVLTQMVLDFQKPPGERMLLELGLSQSCRSRDNLPLDWSV